MSIRERLSEDMKAAMRGREAVRLSTVRMILAAIKDRDIVARGEGAGAASDADLMALLGKMIRSREESATAYDAGGRSELAAREREEIAVIRGYLPQPLSGSEVAEAIQAAIAETGAGGRRDMGRVMDLLRARHAGRIDFGRVGPMVKAALTQG